MVNILLSELASKTSTCNTRRVPVLEPAHWYCLHLTKRSRVQHAVRVSCGAFETAHVECGLCAAVVPLRVMGTSRTVAVSCPLLALRLPAGQRANPFAASQRNGRPPCVVAQAVRTSSCAEHSARAEKRRITASCSPLCCPRGRYLPQLDWSRVPTEHHRHPSDCPCPAHGSCQQPQPCARHPRPK